MPARDFATVMKEWPSVKPATFTRTSTNHLEVARQFKHYEKRFDTVFKILKLTEGDDDETSETQTVYVVCVRSLFPLNIIISLNFTVHISS